jgi:hypothetical protein
LPSDAPISHNIPFPPNPPIHTSLQLPDKPQSNTVSKSHCHSPLSYIAHHILTTYPDRPTAKMLQ